MQNVLLNVLPQSALLTIYKSFIRPHLDYGNIIYDKVFNQSFHIKLESLQYNATLAIAGAMAASSTEKMYEELGLESVKSKDVGTEKCVFFITFSQVNHGHTFLILYQIVIGNFKQEI